VAEIAERARAPRSNGAAAKAAALTVAVLACVSLPNDSHAQTRSVITGNWATRGIGSIVRFAPCAGTAETMCGTIVWLWEPNDASGHPRRDTHNPQQSLRTRSLIGVEIVRGLRETETGVWTDGQLYNPDDGRTYTGGIRLQRGMLELRGCALNVFCDTQTWR